MQTTNNQQPTTCKRIAFIVSKFPCVDETFILQELAVLDENGFDFDIYSIKKSRDRVIQTQAANLVDRLIYRNFIFSTAVLKAQLYFLKTNPIRYIKTWLSFVGQMWRTPLSLLKCLVLYPKAVCYCRMMQQRQIVHVHAFWASYPCAIAWVAHHLTALPYSFSAHAHDIYEENSMLPAKLQKAEFVLTCTEFNRKHLSSLISECEQRIKRIYHGLELEKYREDAAYHKNENGVLRILSIGTLYKTKGFDVLVETCALLKKQRIPFQCKIVGDGPEWKKLQRLIVSLGLQDDVHMLGYLEHDVLRPLRHWANVFILLARPYLHWGLPNVYIEALASKLAVIATPLNAVPELIKHDETGLIVENDNPVATMQALLRMQQFPEDRQRMAEAGQHLAYQLFDAQKTSQQVIEVFREIVTSSVKRPSPAVTARSLRRSSPQSRAGDCFVEDS